MAKELLDERTRKTLAPADISKAERAKHRLQAFVDLQEDLDIKIERLQNLREKIAAIPSSNITGMPRSHGHGDRTSNLVARALDLEKDIAKMRAKETAEREAIRLITLAMPKAREREIIQMRYLDGAKWSEINKIMFGIKDDFTFNNRNYLRRIFRYHGQALCSFADAADNAFSDDEKQHLRLRHQRT